MKYQSYYNIGIFYSQGNETYCKAFDPKETKNFIYKTRRYDKRGRNKTNLAIKCRKTFSNLIDNQNPKQINRIFSEENLFEESFLF